MIKHNYYPKKVEFDRHVRNKMDTLAREMGRPIVGEKLNKRLKERKCCKDPNNMRYAPWLNNKFDRVTLKCKHCGATHYHSALETGKIKIKLG